MATSKKKPSLKRKQTRMNIQYATEKHKALVTQYKATKNMEFIKKVSVMDKKDRDDLVNRVHADDELQKQWDEYKALADEIGSLTNFMKGHRKKSSTKAVKTVLKKKTAAAPKKNP